MLESINTLYSYIYVKSDTWGALNWGYLSPASDNKAVLADISGTMIESNGVWFEGAGFFLRPSGGGGGLGGTSGLIWADFIRCQGLGTGIGVDCLGDPQPAVRYDSPTWGGFRFEASYGTMEPGRDVVDGTPDSNFWDIAAIYTADWNSIKLSAAATYTLFETGAITQDEVNLFQAGASIMHKPSGLGIYGMYQTEESDGNSTATIGINSVTLESITVSNPPPNLNFDLSFLDGNVLVLDRGNQSTDAWYIKPFWRHTWGAANGVGLGTLGATTFYGEFGQYNDQFDNGLNLCSFDNPAGSNLGDFCADVPTVSVLGGLITASAIPGDVVKGAFVDSSEAQRFGLGVVQEIDAAAMHLWARWQHQELDASITGFTLSGQGCFGGLNPGGVPSRKKRSIRASMIGICSRSVGSSSSKPDTELKPNGSRPFGAASFLPQAMASAGTLLTGESRCLPLLLPACARTTPQTEGRTGEERREAPG